jgi:hypothetical protein
MRRAVPLVLLLLVLALPSAAGARGPSAPSWATVNICDTDDAPNEIGIRGAMPGLERRARLYMRVRVQYRDADDRWRLVQTGADSGWRNFASGRRGTYDYGWTFTFKPPTSGGAHVLRGFVSFEWRRGTRVLRRERAFTEAGHPGTAGADPADFSAATCEIA